MKRCKRCGACQECGQVPFTPYPYWSVIPPYTQPVYPTTTPAPISTSWPYSTITVSWTSGTVH